MAEVVNNNPKIVISRTLESVEEGPNWKNIRILNEIRPEEILKLKQKEDITIMGSGTIVQQLANFGLIDEYSLVVVPMILSIFKSVAFSFDINRCTMMQNPVQYSCSNTWL